MEKYGVVKPVYQRPGNTGRLIPRNAGRQRLLQKAGCISRFTGIQKLVEVIRQDLESGVFGIEKDGSFQSALNQISQGFVGH